MINATLLATKRARWAAVFGSTTYTIYRSTRDSDGAGGSVDVIGSVGTCTGRIIPKRLQQVAEGGLIRSVESWVAEIEHGADVSAGDALRPSPADGWEYIVLGVDTSRSDATHLEAGVERRVFV